MKTVWALAVKLLAIREHSVFELRRKLLQRFQNERELVEETLQKLTDTGLQSDARFTEIYIKSRASRGFGPVRIRVELQERGVDEVIIASYLNDTGEQWVALASKVLEKKFGKIPSTQRQDHIKQINFLQYRGFTYEHIKHFTQDEFTTS